MADMRNDMKYILADEEELKSICKNLGAQISKDYEGKNTIIVSVLIVVVSLIFFKKKKWL